MRTELLLNFNKVVRAISSGYDRFGDYGAVEVVRNHYKQVKNVTILKEMLHWVEAAIIDQPFNRGYYSTRRAILSRIDSLSSSSI